jgi:hypothetical protein
MLNHSLMTPQVYKFSQFGFLSPLGITDQYPIRLLGIAKKKMQSCSANLTGLLGKEKTA